MEGRTHSAITLKEWLAMASQTAASISDTQHKAGNRFISAVEAGKSDAYNELAKTPLVEKYENAMLENARLRKTAEMMDEDIRTLLEWGHFFHENQNADRIICNCCGEFSFAYKPDEIEHKPSCKYARILADIQKAKSDQQ